MRLSDETIKRVIDATDIVEVIEGYVSLKKKGQNWWALSPFTDEKTPSFSVSPSKGIYKCFSTGKGGDAVSFIMEMESVNFIEAIKILAKKYGIEVEEKELTPEQEQQQNQKESIYIALNYANNYYQENLHKTNDGRAIGLGYFKERGFQTETIEKFELGYSKNEWNAFEKAAKENGFQEEIIEQAGLLKRNEEKKSIYDRFRGRVMFPIHNLSGRVIAFGARTLKKDEKPKYLNSPETLVYHKSDVLYGIFQAKNAIRNEENCYMVEGYTDVISLYQAGIQNVVASSGTSLTSQQIALVKRFTNKITVLYDGDTAGINASLRGIDLILEKGLDVDIVQFPEGEDPDSYVKSVGANAFKTYLKEKAKDFIFFKIDLLLGDAKHDPIKKAATIRDIVESITRIPDAIKRSVFYKECSQLLDIDEETLIAEGNKLFLKQQQKSKQPSIPPPTDITDAPPIWEDIPPPTHEIDHHQEEEEGNHFQPIEKTVAVPSRIQLQEKEYIRLLLCHGNTEMDTGEPLYQHLLKEIEGVVFHTPIYSEILSLYKNEIALGNEIDVSFFTHHSDSNIKEQVVNLTLEEGVISDNWDDKFGIYVPKKDENISQVVYTNLLRLKHRKVSLLYEEAGLKIKEAENKTFEELMESMKVYKELEDKKKDLAKALNLAP